MDGNAKFWLWFWAIVIIGGPLGAALAAGLSRLIGGTC